ncbi:MAG: YolD-like family protein [Erysipelotrichaceae bacterium]|nr:YolD-like family protein [Erysipelotrichaceae bacterium]
MATSRVRAPRAQMFQPYDALIGFKELLKEQERVVVPKKVLSEDDYEMLNYNVHQIKKGTMVRLVYYDKGQYVEKTGMVAKINLDTRMVQIVTTRINLMDVVEIEIL